VILHKNTRRAKGCESHSRGPRGERLRAIATLGDQSHRTAKAIAWLRANYTKPLRVEELAEVARMGMSTLHHHFRALTAMSPLQYQKQLRLVAARERMLVEGRDAASAAFEVGYERAGHFNRKYKRVLYTVHVGVLILQQNVGGAWRVTWRRRGDGRPGVRALQPRWQTWQRDATENLLSLPRDGFS
jgi:AraC-like DNA-binding protein